MPKKTIKVDDLRAKVNHLMSVKNEDLWVMSPGENREMTIPEAIRMSAANLLEGILMDTGNYHGFGYRDMAIDDNDNPVIPDETRRVYY